MLAPSALLAKRLLAPVRRGRLRRKPSDAAWRLEGAAQFYSGQTKHVRPLRQTEQAWRSHLNRLARPA